LYVRDRGALAARALPESDDATLPFWSPDSRSIGFFAGGKLKRVDLSSGRPQTLATAPVPRGGTWNRDDVILFVPFPEQPPHRVAARDGTPTRYRSRTTGFAGCRHFSDGRHYVYLSFGRGQQTPGIYIGSIDAPDATHLVASHTGATFARSGHLIFRREESLVAQRLNAETLQPEGAAVAVADHVSFNPITQQTLASASDDGVLAYLGAEQVWQLAWFDRSGRRLTNAGTIGGYNSLCLASDGNRVVFDLADPNSGNVDLWWLDLTNGTRAHLTFHPAADFYVACSPTADEVIFSSPRDGTPNLYRLPLSSPGGETSLGKSRVPMLPTQWSRDGRFLLFSAFSPGSDFDVWVQPLAGGEPSMVVATDAVEKGGQLSSDGRWIATHREYGATMRYTSTVPIDRRQMANLEVADAPNGRRMDGASTSRPTRLMAVDVDG
jgi:WD40 repeat protein